METVDEDTRHSEEEPKIESTVTNAHDIEHEQEDNSKNQQEDAKKRIQTEEEEERIALGRITHAMMNYALISSFEINRWKRNAAKLSEQHASLLSHGTIYGDEEESRLTEAIHQNDMFLRYIVHWLVEEGGPAPLHSAFEAADAWRASHGEAVMPADFEKVLYVLKNIARDWSHECQSEREQSYGVLCDTLEQLFPDRFDASSPPRVLIPGCGLGRLCVDLVAKGFDVVGNEHSYFMLMTSAYILNGIAREGQWTIYPWVLQSSNVLSLDHQTQPMSIPDALPLDLVAGSKGSLGMVAGDFIQVFQSEEFHLEYDAVVTCFFLDTAQNVVEYMEVIWDVVRPGGVWVNLGPLQWHWADSHTYLEKEELSIEIPLDKVVEIATHIGFEFEQAHTTEEQLVSCPYMSNPTSMRPQAYKCAFWVARKPLQINN